MSKLFHIGNIPILFLWVFVGLHFCSIVTQDKAQAQLRANPQKKQSKSMIKSEPKLPNVVILKEVLKSIASKIQAPLRIRAFINSDGPEDRLLKEILSEIYYSIPQKKRLDIEEPNKYKTFYEEAIEIGLKEKDGIIRAVIISYKDKTKLIPYIEGDIELILLETLASLVFEPVKIGVINSEEEEFSKLRSILKELRVERVNLKDIDESYKLVIVLPPLRGVEKVEIGILDSLIKGRIPLLFFVDYFEVIEGKRGLRVEPLKYNYKELLEQYGIKVLQGLVLDRNCGRVSIPARFGRMVLAYPPLVLVNIDRERLPIGMDRIEFPFPSPIVIDKKEEYNYTVFIQSSTQSWLLTSKFDFDPRQNWVPTEIKGPFYLGVKVEDPKMGLNLSVISNSRFLRNRYIERGNNIDFLRRFILWLQVNYNLPR